MPYEPTSEDMKNIADDFEDLVVATHKATTTLRQMMDMHIACPVMRELAEGLLEQILVDHPPLRMLMVIDPDAGEGIRQACYFAYLVGLNGKYPTMLPCTESHPDHLHEVEDLLDHIQEEGD